MPRIDRPLEALDLRFQKRDTFSEFRRRQVVEVLPDLVLARRFLLDPEDRFLFERLPSLASFANIQEAAMKPPPSTLACGSWDS